MDFKEFLRLYSLYQQYQAPPQYQQHQAPPQYQNNEAIEAMSRQLNDMSMRLTGLTLSQNQPGGVTEDDMVMGFFDSVINPGKDGNNGK